MRRYSICPLIVVAVGACALLAPAAAQATSTKTEIEESASRGVSYLKSLQLTSGGFESEWDLSALAADGVAAANVQKSGAETNARTWYRELVGNETATKWPPKAAAVEYERAALNAYAAGIEPARVSKTQDLIAGILSFYQPEHAGYYGEPEVFEGTIFGLLALADAKTEEGAERVPAVLLERSAAVIEANQHTDGGWSYQKAEGNETVRKAAAEPDTTGAAMAALCAAGATPATSESVRRAVTYLKSVLVSASGAFESELGPNTDSNAWAVSGLNACGINPQEEGFTSASHKTPIDFLISQQLAGGGFKYLASGTSASEYASQDAVRALAGAGFTSVPPVPSGGSERWFAASGFSPSKGVKSPLALIVNNGAGTLKACSVSLAPETATTTLEAVLKAAEADSAPSGCITSHASEASTEAITQIDGYASTPTREWTIGIDGGAREAAKTSSVIGLGDTIYLTLAQSSYQIPELLEGLTYKAPVRAGSELSFTVPSGGRTFSIGPMVVSGAVGESAQVTLVSGNAFEQTGKNRYRETGQGIVSSASGYVPGFGKIFGPLNVACTAPADVALAEIPIVSDPDGNQRQYSASFEAECVLAPGELNELVKSRVTMSATGPEEVKPEASVTLGAASFSITMPASWRENLLGLGVSEVRGRSASDASAVVVPTP